MKVKTTDLQGAALDWAVAKCEYTDRRVEIHETTTAPQVERGPGTGDRYGIGWFSFRASTNPAQGQPILERERISTSAYADSTNWGAYKLDQDGSKQNWIIAAPTMLIAGLRCYVASKLGDEVDVPEELVQA